MNDFGDKKMRRLMEWTKENVMQEKPLGVIENEEKGSIDEDMDKEDIRDAEFEVEISKDLMKAFLFVIPPKGGKMMTYGEVVESIKEKGITFGVDYGQINQIIENEIFFKKVEIAKGINPVHGKDGEIKLYFDIKKNIRPKFTEDDKADFFNLDYVNNVKKGQLLAEIIPPTEGKPGKTITGKTLLAKHGKKVKLTAGKNIKISEDGLKLYSEIDGQPQLQGTKLSVVPVLEIKGDVGPATGNIDFVGSVLIRGRIKSGFRVVAKGDVQVERTLEDAEIKAGGNIILQRGIQGRKRGILEAGGDVVAKYIENSTVRADQNIIIADAVMHSQLYAGKKIIIEGKKGLLAGGSSRAGEELKAKVIGSPLSTYTEIEVGIDPELKKMFQEVNEKIESIDMDIHKARQALNMMEKLKEKGLLTKGKEKLMEKLRHTNETLICQREKAIEKKEKIEALLKYSNLAKVSAINVAYSGVNIIIGNAQMKLKDKIEHVTFYNHEGQIKFRPFEE